jgi:hypothetical protein
MIGAGLPIGGGLVVGADVGGPGLAVGFALGAGLGVEADVLCIVKINCSYA